MNAPASQLMFAGLIGIAIVGAAIAAIVLIVLFLWDWRTRKLW